VLGADIPSDEPLMAAGLDSLGAVELHNALQESMGVELPSTLMFDYPSVDAIADFLHKRQSRDREGVVPTTKPRLQQKLSEIYSIPTLSVLNNLGAEQISAVPDFCIGRHGYGHIMFMGVTDLSGINLETTVKFVRGGFVVYPEGATKPPVGHGLNRPAIVTLQKMLPKRSSSFEKFEANLQKMLVKMKAILIDYDRLTGTLIFKVRNFETQEE